MKKLDTKDNVEEGGVTDSKHKLKQNKAQNSGNKVFCKGQAYIK